MVEGLGKRDYEALGGRSNNTGDNVHQGEQPTDVFEFLGTEWIQIRSSSTYLEGSQAL